MRRFAVGKLLGVGHIALLVYASFDYLPGTGWGRELLSLAYRLSVETGGTVSTGAATSLQANQLISDSSHWVSQLPWGLTVNVYLLLAVGCLIVRLARRMPGWLSLAIALPASVYGLLGGVSGFPALVAYWPLTCVTLIAAWIAVGKTVGRY